jgi:hypothetical protein
MKYKRTSFCGPAGDGFLSRFFLWLLKVILDFLKLNFEQECQKHDIDWSLKNGGPNTVDDIEFALRVYKKAKKTHQRTAGIISFFAFIFVRITALIYKTIQNITGD